MLVGNVFLLSFVNWALMHYIFCTMQTTNPIGCQCPLHYVLNSHFQCVRPPVNPTDCSCPTNYQLNSRNRCECALSSNDCGDHLVLNPNSCTCELRCSPADCSGGFNQPVELLNCVCPPHWDGMIYSLSSTYSLGCCSELNLILTS